MLTDRVGIYCPNVIVVTDHQPLTGIFGDRDLGKVNNPRLFRLKEKCLRYHFTIQHCPGKWHRGADAISRNPVATVESLISICPTNPSPKDIHLSNSRDVAMELAAIQAAVNIDNNTTVIIVTIIAVVYCCVLHNRLLINQTKLNKQTPFSRSDESLMSSTNSYLGTSC